MSTVIIGSGIIGVSTAYFLSEERNPPSSIHLVEASPELFASASGFAAGFLARDWFSPSLSPLGALSFDLHRQLAEQYNGRDNWSYTGSITTSLGEMSGDENSKWLDEGLSRARTAKKSAFKDAFGPQWLTISHENLDIISNCETTAQMQVSYVCIRSCNAFPDFIAGSTVFLNISASKLYSDFIIIRLTDLYHK